MRILLVTNTLPYPPISGFPLRVYSLLQRIARNHEVWLVSLVTGTPDPENISHLRILCRDVLITTIPKYGGFDKPKEWLSYSLAGIPPDLRFYHSDCMEAAIRDLTSNIGFDIIQIEDSYMARYIEALPDDINSKTVLTFHDIVFEKYDRIFKLESKPTRKLRRWLHSRMMRSWEPHYAERFDLCITMSERDRSLLLDVNPRLHVEVVPNGVDTQTLQLLPYDDLSPGLIFVGNMSYLPNIDAILYLYEEILPYIKRVIPNIEVWVVGIDPSPALEKLNEHGVHVTGRVDNVQPYYKRSSVCVIPLRAGGGTRLKILESMALGRPVVSTTIGCEGLDVEDGKHLFIADAADEFAEKVLLLLANKEKRQQIIDNARRLVETHYNWDILANKYIAALVHIINDLGHRGSIT